MSSCPLPAIRHTKIIYRGRAQLTTLFAESGQSIEEQDAWQLLWYKSVARSERVVQALFRSVVIHYCRSHGIDLSGESNAGRGPVDFKFSQGWNARAIVEIKLMRNSSFWNGILQQTPQYARSEEVKAAYFVAVAYTDDEMTPSRLQKVDQAAQIASRTNAVELRLSDPGFHISTGGHAEICGQRANSCQDDGISLRLAECRRS
jgi:hypothetical protein